MQPANSVLVLMARGITERWKQPLAFHFVRNSCGVGDLKQILFTTISRLNEVGLDVKVVVSDMGSNFVKLSSELGVTTNKPYFVVSSFPFNINAGEFVIAISCY